VTFRGDAGDVEPGCSIFAAGCSCIMAVPNRIAPRNIPRTAALPAPNRELTMSNPKTEPPIIRKKIPTSGYRLLTR
jgi:hypothetical protein